MLELIAKATLERKQIRIQHFNRQTGITVERIISPQQMVHYRDNWYVDAWCHLRKEIRSFAVDAITECEQLIEDAKELDAEQTITQLITKNAKFVFCEFCPSTGPFTEPGSVCPSSPHTLPFSHMA